MSLLFWTLENCGGGTWHTDRQIRHWKSWKVEIRLLYISPASIGLSNNHSYTGHDDVIKWKHFPRYWPFVRGIHRLPVNSPHKGQWHGALMFSLMYAWINRWVNNKRGWWFETPSRSLWRHCNELSTGDRFKVSQNVLSYNLAKQKRNLCLEFSILPEIWQASQQHCCRIKLYNLLQLPTTPYHKMKQYQRSNKWSHKNTTDNAFFKALDNNIFSSWRAKWQCEYKIR